MLRTASSKTKAGLCCPFRIRHRAIWWCVVTMQISSIFAQALIFLLSAGAKRLSEMSRGEVELLNYQAMLHGSWGRTNKQTLLPPGSLLRWKRFMFLCVDSAGVVHESPRDQSAMKDGLKSIYSFTIPILIAVMKGSFKLPPLQCRLEMEETGCTV